MAKETTTDPDVITNERKQELLEAARAQAEETVPTSTTKIGPGLEAVQTLDDTSGHPDAPRSASPSVGFVEAVAEPDSIPGFQTPVYGPYNDYYILQTEWGEFACPKGEVLWFVAKSKFSPKTGEFIIAHYPRHAKPKDCPPHIKELLGVGA